MEPGDEDLKEYLKIRRMVRRCLARSFDQDNLAAQIWLEMWRKSAERGKRIRVTWLHVRRKCIDEVRRVARKREVNLIEALDVPIRNEKLDHSELLEVVDHLMECPTLTSKHRRLVYDKYWRGLSNGDLARSQGLSLTVLKESVRELVELLQEWIIEVGLEEDLMSVLGLPTEERNE